MGLCEGNGGDGGNSGRRGAGLGVLAELDAKLVRSTVKVTILCIKKTTGTHRNAGQAPC